jgi:GT2 family glycosyltransferase
MTSPDLSVLIVTFNSGSFIDLCIDAVRSTVSARTYEIIVADNASSDDSLTRLRARGSQLTLIDMGANTGFAVANNAAFRASTGRNVVLLNGDAVVQPGALNELVRFLDEHPDAGVVAPKLENPDGTDQGTARSFPSPAAALFGRRSVLTRLFPRNRFSRHYLSGREHAGDEPFEVDWVSGACLMLRRDVALQAEMLDENFFMYWEDADLCRRVKQAEHGVWCVPGARVMHTEGSSTDGWPPIQVRHFHRSAYHYYAKHHLTGAKRGLRPVAAAALALRALLVMARERIRTTSENSMPPERATVSPVGAVDIGDFS